MPRAVPVVAVLLLAPAARAADPADDFFQPTKVWQFHLALSAKEYAGMQPAAGGFGGFGPPPAPRPKAAGDREAHRNAFGVDMPWAVGAFTADGTTFENVGLRYKGNGTYLESARNLKRSIKVDLDRHNPEQRFRGLKAVNLHSGVADPSKGRETLAYGTFRAAGVPAPRTTLAEVTLSVPGKFDKELLGVFTVVEQVDKPFLKKYFGDGGGLLMKPERIRGLDYLGEDWPRYADNYLPKREATPDEQKRVIAFAKLVNQADDARFRKEIHDYLDVDGFLRFAAANALLVNLDGFFTLGHNYYLYLHPTTKKFHFFPWDVDRAVANFGVFGSSAQQMDLSLAKQYPGPNRLPDRLFAQKDIADRYQAILKEAAKACFTKDRLLGEVKVIEAAVKEPLAREAKAVAARREQGGPMFFGPVPSLATFVDKRTASVEAQLAGTSKGYTPQPFGPPGGGFGNPIARPLVERLDADKDGKVTEDEMTAGMKRLFKEWDRNGDGALSQEEVTQGLQRLQPPPPGFGPPKK